MCLVELTNSDKMREHMKSVERANKENCDHKPVQKIHFVYNWSVNSWEEQPTRRDDMNTVIDIVNKHNLSMLDLDEEITWIMANE